MIAAAHFIAMGAIMPRIPDIAKEIIRSMWGNAGSLQEFTNKQ